MKKECPWFKMYPARYFRDTRQMNEAQKVQYLEDLLCAWMDGELDAMPEWMRENWQETLAHSEKQAQKGKKGAEKRWQKDGHGIATAIPKHSHGHTTVKPRHSHGIAEENRENREIRIENTDKDIFVRDRTELEGQKATFEKFRLAYPGRKVGFATEWGNFAKKAGKDLGAIVEALNPALEVERDHREKRRLAGAFLPEWKNLKTWINNRCWEQSFGEIVEQPKRLTYQQENEKGYAELFQDIKDGRFLSEHID